MIWLNSNSGEKWTNQNFMVKSIRILVRITRILIDIITLVKILVDFTRNINQNSIILTRINLTREFWFVHFQPEIFLIQYLKMEAAQSYLESHKVILEYINNKLFINKD